jgi:hypothetical protein
MKRLALTFLILSCIVLSCKKNDTTTYGTGYTRPPISQASLDYGYFKQGTYWIYRDSSTLQLDSVYVTSARIFDYNGNHGFMSQGYNTYFRSSFEKRDYCIDAQSHWDPYPWGFSPFSGNDLYKGYTTPPGDTLDPCFYLQFSAKIPSNSLSGYGHSNDSMSYLSTTASYLLGTTLLTNVIITTHSHDPSCSLKRTKMYLRRNYGLLRREIPDSNRVWNLIRCKIVQ